MINNYPELKMFRQGLVFITLQLDSPSRLAVVTKQIPSLVQDERRIRSQGKVSSACTSTISPT